MEKYIIFGASGLVGSEIVKMCEEKNLDYIGVYRSLPKNIKINPQKSWIGNLEDFPADYLNNSHVFCCLGSSIKHAKTKENFIKIEIDVVFNLAQKCQHTKVKSFNVISALYASKNSMIFYSKVKGILEEKLLQLNFNSLNIFRPSLLSGNRREFRLLEQLAIKILEPFNFLFNIPPLLTYKVMPAKLLAMVMLNLCLTRSGINILNNKDIHLLKKAYKYEV